MRKLKKLLTIFCALATVVALSACARQKKQNSWPRIQQQKKIVVGLDDSFVPMGFRAKSGKLEGYDIDLARALFKHYGVKVSFQPIDWSMKETELRNQTIDLIWNGYSVTPERKKQVRFSEPYLKNHQVLVTKRSSNITSFADMKGKTVGAQTGSSGAADIDGSPKLLKNIVKGKQPILYDTFNDAFIDLNANRIQGLIIDEVYGRYYIAHQKDPKAYRVTEGSFPAEAFAIGMRKSDTELDQKINSELNAMRKDGEIAKIQKKWFGN
ncbi:amino acid ABC transporter substrate-binding protein [Lacticaseibacillus zhaodongensis]|uniref:amino acid ABC transporter substrate-binding protein n=1 Tax=Lacticaseibacillus zhaodongensis TaxID=2668065 RepID=UPI0012D2C061|nr:amino acid ABC transporter substrate-binding protein [Lacticaseibacillus zhaodongensis]